MVELIESKEQRSHPTDRRYPVSHAAIIVHQPINEFCANVDAAAARVGTWWSFSDITLRIGRRCQFGRKE